MVGRFDLTTPTSSKTSHPTISAGALAVAELDVDGVGRLGLLPPRPRPRRDHVEFVRRSLVRDDEAGALEAATPSSAIPPSPKSAKIVTTPRPACGKLAASKPLPTRGFAASPRPRRRRASPLRARAPEHGLDLAPVVVDRRRLPERSASVPPGSRDDSDDGDDPWAAHVDSS
jgi:hypothetical protein